MEINVRLASQNGTTTIEGASERGRFCFPLRVTPLCGSRRERRRREGGSNKRRDGKMEGRTTSLPKTFSKAPLRRRKGAAGCAARRGAVA